MNIQRFKWPVMVAAGLHGALFLSLPHTSIGITKPTAEPTGCTLGQKDDPIEMPASEGEFSKERILSGGGRTLPELPDAPVALPDHAVFKVDVEQPKPATTGIRDLAGCDGRPAGPGLTWDGIQGTTIVSRNLLDREPRATVQLSPDYPPRLRQDGLGGSVTVEFVVDTAGRVVRAEAISSTHRDFAEPAVRAVLKWRFEPGTRQGKAVPFRMAVPIEFNVGSN